MSELSPQFKFLVARVPEVHPKKNWKEVIRSDLELQNTSREIAKDIL